MAMTELTLIWMGSLATLATIGMFVDFGDNATGVIVSFVASILWGFFGISSFDVVIADDASVSEPILPLAYLGIGLGVVIGIFTFYRLVRAVGRESGATEAQGFI